MSHIDTIIRDHVGTKIKRNTLQYWRCTQEEPERMTKKNDKYHASRLKTKRTNDHERNYEKNFWIAKNIVMNTRIGQVTAAAVRPMREKGDTVILKIDEDTGFE